MLNVFQGRGFGGRPPWNCGKRRMRRRAVWGWNVLPDNGGANGHAFPPMLDIQ